jgi:hypothetical protein
VWRCGDVKVWSRQVGMEVWKMIWRCFPASRIANEGRRFLSFEGFLFRRFTVGSFKFWVKIIRNPEKRKNQSNFSSNLTISKSMSLS